MSREFGDVGAGWGARNAGVRGRKWHGRASLVALLAAGAVSCNVSFTGERHADEAGAVGAERSALITDPLLLDVSRCGNPGVLCVNFQERGKPVPAGHLADFGDAFAPRNGQAYGWSRAVGCFDRNKVADQRLDTFCRMPGDVTWELALPNGPYLVRAVVGDANGKALLSLFTEGQGVDEEPEEFWQGVGLPSQKFLVRTIRVFVSDGRLTLFARGDVTPLVLVEVSPDAALPAPPPFDAGAITKVCTGSIYSMALLEDGSVWSWGRGALGQGDELPRTRPTPIPRLSNVVDIDCEQNRSVAVDAQGTVWEWGTIPTVRSTDPGTFGDTDVPSRVLDISNVVRIGTSNNHTVALDRNARLWSWGANFSGQLGNGSTNDVIAPTQVKDLRNLTALSVSGGQSMALRNDGTVWVSGANPGNGTATPVTRFAQVPGLSNVVDIAASGSHSFAIRGDGTALSWGLDNFGLLCNGEPLADSFVPAPISADSWATATTGGGANLLTRADGTLWSCGFNRLGTLGDGTQIDRSAPVRVDELAFVQSIDASSEFTLMAGADGSLWAWGSNLHGQFGDGTTDNISLVPRRIF